MFGGFVKHVKLVMPIVLMYSCFASANDFKGLYEVGIKNNLRLKAQTSQQQSEKQQENVSFAGLLPTVAATGSWNYLNQNNAVHSDSYLLSVPDQLNQSDQMGYEIAVSQPLFNMPSYHAFNEGKAVAARADIQMEFAMYEYTNQYIQSYINIATMQSRVKNIEQTIIAYTNQKQLITEQYTSGLAKPSDLAQAKAELAIIEADLIVAKNNLNLAFEQLELVIQSDIKAIEGFKDNFAELAVINQPLGHYLKQFSNNIQYRLSEANMKVANQQLKRNASLWMPSVTANLSYSDNHLDRSFNYQPGNRVYQDGFAVSIQLRVPLYSGGRDTYMSQSAAYEFEQAKYLKQFQQHQIQQSIKSVYSSLKAGIASIAARKNTIAAAKAVLTNARQEYTTGIGQYIDVVNSQSRLFDETNQLIEEKARFLSNLMSLDRLTGKDPKQTIEQLSLLTNQEKIANENAF